MRESTVRLGNSAQTAFVILAPFPINNDDDDKKGFSFGINCLTPD